MNGRLGTLSPPAVEAGALARGLRRSRSWMWLAGALFVAIFVLRLVISGPEHPIALLYAIPVLIVAVERGAAAGVAAALGAILLGAIWDFWLSPYPAHAFEEYLIRALIVIGLAVSVGMLATRLRESVESQARFWELSTDLLATVDASGRFTAVSPSWTKALGWTEQELCARPFIEFVHPDDRNPTLGAFAGGIGGGPPDGDYENRYIGRDGKYRILQWRGSFEPETGLMHAVARDVTERKEIQGRLQEAMENATLANEAKSEFLSRMSHELRTPLNSILGFTQLLELSDLGPEDREAVTHIHEGGQHLLRLVNEVLEISVIETGHMRISLEPLPAPSILREVLDLLAPLAAEAEVELSGFAEPGLMVLADRQRLSQVLINLINNAVKYNGPGGSVTVDCERAGPARVQFVVADDGPGMDATQLRSVFTPFERLGAERRRVEGTGLGLPLAKRLVELMGGTLEPLSAPGRGTTMVVALGLAVADAETRNGDETPVSLLPAIELQAGKARRIVYIEDDDASAELVERALAFGEGVQVHSAASGSEGLDLVREHRPDLVLLDLDLPDLSGIEVLELLKQDPVTARIPVVVVSAATTRGQVERLLDAGADGYLTKPVEIARLIELTFDPDSGREREPGPL